MTRPCNRSLIMAQFAPKSWWRRAGSEDVQAINESDDGTIILSGDSEDLSIDLGDVLEEGGGGQHDQLDSEESNITFNDDSNLEVVDFDSGNTVDMNMTAGTEDLSFTDSNTAAVTSIDETVVKPPPPICKRSTLATPWKKTATKSQQKVPAPDAARVARLCQQSPANVALCCCRTPSTRAFNVVMGLCAVVMFVVLPCPVASYLAKQRYCPKRHERRTVSWLPRWLLR